MMCCRRASKARAKVGARHVLRVTHHVLRVTRHREYVTRRTGLSRDGSGSSSGNTPHSTPKASPQVKGHAARELQRINMIVVAVWVVSYN